MIDAHRLVACTPAGRRGPMECLAALLLNDPDVDRWDIWLNTEHRPDIDYIDSLGRHPKVRVVRLGVPVTHPVAYRIHRFFPTATDADTVYVRLDDDIVWYEPGAVRRVAERRLADPHPFLVYGNVLNSGLTSYRHQQLGRIPAGWGRLRDECMDPVSWGDGPFAVRLHEVFLGDPWPARWHLDDFTLADYRRHSINVISWLGADAAGWARTMGADEEAWLSHQEPARTRRPCVVRGDTLFCHLSFHTQAAAVDQARLLDRYRALATDPWGRLERAAVAVESAADADARDPRWLARTLATAGLFSDGRPMYGRWEACANPTGTPGLWQHPDEFAAFLIRVAARRPRRVLELGTFYGFLAVLLAAYLRRWVPDAEVVTADWHRWLPDPLPHPLRRVAYRPLTHSGHYAGQPFDLAFIDADHARDAADLDYARLNHCPAVAFHDINDHCVRDRCPRGGVYALWRDLKATRPAEEFLRDDGAPWMGIGLLT